MALVDYMGDAPGFMSYSRQPLTGFSHLPTFKAPPKAPSISPDLKSEDDKGLSGDAEFYSNTQKSFEQGISELSKKYGGELNAFALSSPEYKELVKKQQHDVYSKQSLRNNEIKKKQYDSDLLASTNGQHADDIALEWNESIKDYTDKQFKIPDGKGGYVTSGPLTKKQYSDLSESKPNIDYVDKEGNLAIVPIEYDYGKGDAETTINEVNNMLTNTGFKKTGGGKDDTIRVSINGVTDQQLRNWSDGHHMDNFDAINGLSKFINEKGGLSKDSKYFLAQNFRNKISDPVNGGYEYFEFDEQGKPVPQKGGGHKRRHYTQEEIDSNPMLKNMMQKEFQVNFVQDYLTTKKTLDTYGKRGSVFENLDRSGNRTGGVDKEDDKYYFTNWLQNGASPDAEEKEVTVPVIDKNGKTTIGRAVFTAISGANNFNQVEKSKASLVGKSLSEISGGSAGYDGIFSKVGGHLTGGVIGDVLEVGQMAGIPLKYNKNTGAYESILDHKSLENYKKVDSIAKSMEGKATQFEISKFYNDNGFADPTMPMAKVVVFNDGTSYDVGQGELTLDEDNVLTPTHTVGMFGATTTDEGKKYEVDATKYNSFAKQKELHPRLSGKGTVVMVPLNPILFREQDSKDITKSKNTERVSGAINRGNMVMGTGSNATGTKVSQIK